MTGLPANFASLMSAGAYPHPVEQVHLIETHVSWVLLAGELAYKIKRPVRYPFVDMRSAAQRLFFCREEIRLNRRFAPDLYLDVVPITAEGGVARIGGTGEVIEHAVRMRQFDTHEELDRLVRDARVEPEELAQFGRYLARIHEHLPQVGADERYGSRASVTASLRENVAQLESLSRKAGLRIDSHAVRAPLFARLEESGPLIEARRAHGRVRECHGDLHCRNVVRTDGRLIAFDALEFDPSFRWIDVAEEIAFLFMDLSRRNACTHALAFVNAYLSECGDYEALRLLRLYGAHRALVRAKVAALDSAGAKAEERERQASEHQAYVDCAADLLERQRPLLILMSGLSGSGKTWLAERLAARIGAVHIRSDVERKRLAGLGAEDSSRSAIDQGLYAREGNETTYRRLASCASDVVAADFPAVTDATFQRRADRALFGKLAADLNVRLILIRCRAPAEVLRERIVDRARQGGDASEADLAVLERQQQSFEAIDPAEGLETIDADTTRSTVVDDIERIVSARS